MSKFEATVCLPPTPPTRLLDALDTALAPYDIDAGPDGYNGRGQWDWWRVGGFGGPRLPVRPEFDGDPRLIHNPLWPNSDPRPYQRLRCDGGPKEAIDIAAVRHEAKVTACGEWQVWIDLVANHPPARPLSHFMALHQRDPVGYPVARAEREHLTQPLIQTITRHAVDGSDPYVSTDVSHGRCDPLRLGTRVVAAREAV